MSIHKIKAGSAEHQLIASTRYATCSTASGTSAKVATLVDGSTLVLETGVRVTVKFTNANSVASPTLNINSTGAKPIYWHGSAMTLDHTWSSGAVQDFIYNGSQWELVGNAKTSYLPYPSTNNVTFQGQVYLTNGTDTSYLRFAPSGETATWDTIQASHPSANTGNKIQFVSYSRSSSDFSRLDTYESFSLPQVDPNRIENKAYEIITSKGGTIEKDLDIGLQSSTNPAYLSINRLVGTDKCTLRFLINGESGEGVLQTFKGTENQNTIRFKDNETFFTKPINSSGSITSGETITAKNLTLNNNAGQAAILIQRNFTSEDNSTSSMTTRLMTTSAGETALYLLNNSNNSVNTLYLRTDFAEFTKPLTIPSLTINNRAPAITFNNTENNYIKLEASSRLGFSFGDNPELTNSSLVLTSTAIIPGATETFNIGSTNYKWDTIYANTFNGTATQATKATQDGSGNTITSTYLKRAGGTMTGELILNPVDSTSAVYLTSNRLVGDVQYKARFYVNGETGAASIQLRDDTAAVEKNKMTLGLTETTFKQPVNIAGGGTGATTRPKAWENIVAGGGTFTGTPLIRNSTYYSSLWFAASKVTGSNIRNGVIYCWSNTSSTNTTVDRSQFTFRQYIPNSGTTEISSAYESFDLPATLAGGSAGNYNILTTKNTVTVEQGGTGSTSKPGARTNLGITSGTSLPDSASVGDIFFLYS